MRLVGASEDVPISAARFWSLNFLLFYAYYAFSVGLFALFWFFYARIAGSAGQFLERL
jgi:peptide/bleomycin uptake transporter